MSDLEGAEAMARRANLSSHDRANAPDDSTKSLDGSFGTLGATPGDPTDFFGSNEGAYIDGDGFLHGLPPCGVLEAGFVVFPSLVFEQCIQVHLAQRWPEFAETLEADLGLKAGEGADPAESDFRAKALSLLANQPERIPFENGLIAIPRAVMDETGVDGSEAIVVAGNDGYFEVSNKAAHDRAMQEIDLLDILFGD